MDGYFMRIWDSFESCFEEGNFTRVVFGFIDFISISRKRGTTDKDVLGYRPFSVWIIENVWNYK